MLIFLGIFIGVLSVAIGLATMSEAYDLGGTVLGLAIMVIGVFIGVMCIKTDINNEKAKFQQVVASKQYQTSVTMINGVYKDKIVSNEDKQYTLDLEYSQIKELPELKPNDVVKITYVTSVFDGRYIISVEKIK